ncbi:uncharacterized protein LOC111830541 [Capsella rubella]|uniref:uncharacterized protein LOC111830541 n=1 Tax=Capsella rubella TaxID=81985 RepID=UPI000CD5787D|nr:uncharacterized protein LOC111830541 [Capsella rubella]
MYCKDWVFKAVRRGVQGELSIGGLVTPLLVACDVELRGKVYNARWIDIETLTRTHFLDSECPNGFYLYKFTHPSLGAARMVLPNTELTKIRLGANIDFWPPVSALYDPRSVQDPVPSFESAQQTYAPEIREEEPAREDQEEDFYFDEWEESSKQSRGVKEAHEKISILQKWNKFQSKTITALKNTVKDLAGTVKDMGEQIKELQNKVGCSTSTTAMSSNLGRSASVRTHTKSNLPVSPPRASFDPRRSLFRTRREPGADTSTLPERTPDRAGSSHPVGSAYHLAVDSENIQTEHVAAGLDVMSSWFGPPPKRAKTGTLGH